MAKIKGIELSEVQRAALEQAHRHGPSHAFRQRCQMVLLKSQGLPSRTVWQERGLFLFYLPVYSPHLNLAETLWRHLKHLWLTPHDYLHEQTLFYQTRQALAAVGSLLHIHLAPPLLHVT